MVFKINKVKFITTCIFLFVGIIAGSAQSDIWKNLAKISYKKEYDAVMGFKIDKPVFGESIKAMEGKEVEVKGYIIPVDGYKSHKEFVFSAFPYSQCFFCGGAGPETVMEVEAKDAIKFTAESIVFKGILSLNDSDVNRLMFKISKATLVK
ncbi:MAG TPA: hypothetical protein PLY70_11555 [Saprospiraceae bacterium]|nr:hypothetical protein [Saprospiraceae bacterium]